jgi:beta-lactam-binding protein with PASTA domain/predicted Ser/Thr protein kinase
VIGHQIGGRYRIIRRLGGGGMGVVYQAEDMLLGRDVAVKVLRAHLAEDDAFRRRFAREGRSAAALSHPNIVQVYDVGETPEGVPYLVMEYVEGRTLERIVRERGALGEREAVDVAIQVASALAEAHRRGVVHRDIKPLNILVRADGTVKVADFGIARAASGATLVNTGTIVGSAHYVSPEQARGGYVDEKTDVYSLGVVLFEMLTGRTPFQGDTAIAVALKHLQEEVPAPSSLANVSRRLEAVVLRALEKDPSRRYPNAGALLADLEGVRAALEAGGGGARAARRRAQPTRASLLVPLAAAFIVLLVGLAAYLYEHYAAPRHLRLPSLVGQPLAQAESALRRDGLRWRLAAPLTDAAVTAGAVAQTTPRAGASVTAGSTVVLRASAGPPAVAGGVPDVRGQTLAPAEEELTGLGLRVVQVIRRPSNVYGPGEVAATLPPPGTPAWRGQAVTLVLSSGAAPAAVPMPSLVGLMPSAWRLALARRGLTVTQVRYGSSRLPAGRVLAQAPAPGTPVTPGSDISLVLSPGAGGAPVAVGGALEQQSAAITLPTHLAAGTPVTVDVRTAAGTEVVDVTRGRPGEVLTVTYTWQGEGELEVWVGGALASRLPLPVASAPSGG